MAQKDNYIGFAMGLDVTDLKAGLQETKRQITTAGKEFKNATADMDNWKESSEGLQAKLKQLSTTLEMQKKVVNGYQAELDKTVEKFGENSVQARNLRDKLLDAETAVKKTQKSLDYFNGELERVQQEEKEATSVTGKLTRAFGDLDNATIDVKGGFTVLKGAMANFVSTAVTSLVSGLKSAVDESREFRREIAYLQQTADATGSSFDNAKENLKEITAITEDSGAGVEGLNNLMSAGFDGDALDNITDQLLGASIKWKDTLKFEGLSDGLQETLATGKAIGPFAELLERAGLNLDDFDEGLANATTEAEKQQYVLDTLNKLGLKEIKDGYVESNKSLIDGAKANFEYSEAMANLGEKAEPVLTTVKMGFVDVLNAIFDAVKGLDTADFQAKIKDAFQFFIDDVLPVIKDGIKFVIKHKEVILALITSIGAGFVAWKVASIIGGIVTAFKKWKTITEGVTLAQKLLNTVMKANPIGIVITLIAGLVAGFIYLWNTSDKFRNFWIGLWEAIKTGAKVVVDWLVNAVKNLWNFVTNIPIIQFYVNIWKKIFDDLIPCT